jgi:hypothetical protein
MPPEGFITFDNLYYIGIADKENAEEIEQLLRHLALYDHNKFQALLLGLQGTIPAELEEELYRLKGVRLAEEGYLPFEEAVSVYAYQDVSKLKRIHPNIYFIHLTKRLRPCAHNPFSCGSGRKPLFNRCFRYKRLSCFLKAQA